MSKIILGIHGLGNKPAKQVLESWWKQSLREGFRLINSPNVFFNFELVYWADIMHPEPQDINISDPGHPLYLEEYYYPARKIKVNEPGTLRKKIHGYIDKQIDKLFLNDDMTLNFSSISDKIIHHYFRDLEAYYSDSPEQEKSGNRSFRDQVRERLATVLRKYEKDEILLLSHSMGSIIAYDVLTHLTPDINIQTFITVGSPLGMPIIVGRIFAEQKKKMIKVAKVRTPDSVRKNWFNFADWEDRIAIDAILKDDFDENIHHVRAVDISVHNDYENRGVRNAHKIYGYLRTPEMAEVISDFLMQGKSKFLLKFEQKINRWFSDFIEKYK